MYQELKRMLETIKTLGLDGLTLGQPVCEYKLTQKFGIPVICISGDVARSASATILQQLKSVVFLAGSPSMIVDLTDARSIDVTIIGALEVLAAQCDRAGGVVACVMPSEPYLQQVLHDAKLILSLNGQTTLVQAAYLVERFKEEKGDFFPPGPSICLGEAK
jgi:anti-anti-sigma regulatory factor